MLLRRRSLKLSLGVAVEEDGGFGELPELASFVSAFLVRWPTHPPDLGLAVAHLPIYPDWDRVWPSERWWRQDVRCSNDVPATACTPENLHGRPGLA